MEETSKPIDIFTSTNAMTSNNTQEKAISNLEFISFVMTTVVAMVLLLALVLTLISFIGFWKFRARRTHVVTINLSTSLLIFQIAYIMSNFIRHYHYSTNFKYMCLTGAFISHFGLLCVWFWMTSYWILLMFMFKRPLGSYISHFFIKITFPCYGFSIIISVLTITIAKIRGELFVNNKEASEALNLTFVYANKRCIIDGMYLVCGLILTPAFLLCFILSVFLFLIIGFIRKKNDSGEHATLKRIKVHLFKLVFITLTSISVLASLIISSTYMDLIISDICYTIGTALLGLALLFHFCKYQNEIYSNWKAILSGKRQLMQQRSMSAGKNDSLSVCTIARTSVAVGRNILLQNFEEEIDPQLKTSSLRFVPKDDTDMSNLNLINIPGTPEVNNKSVRNKRKSKHLTIQLINHEAKPDEVTAPAKQSKRDSSMLQSSVESISFVSTVENIEDLDHNKCDKEEVKIHSPRHQKYSSIERHQITSFY